MRNENPILRRLAARAADEDDRLVLQWMSQIDCRVRQLESCLRGLAGRVSDQDEAVRMMCSVLKEIDDPYGLGQSLDERLFGDAAQGSSDLADD
jgi:hypothetical protein